MATGAITKRSVDATVKAERDIFLWDAGDKAVKGFGLKVTPAGTKTYLFQYRMGGRGAATRRVRIGAHGDWTPERARAEAKRLSALVDTGQDPGIDKQERRREAIDLAFGPYVERFIKGYLATEWQGSGDLAASLLRREAIPALKLRTIKQVTRADISDLMDKMKDRPAARRNLFAILRRMFRWAINRGDLAESPLRDMDPPPAPASRDRVLDDAEMALAWQAAVGLCYPFGPMVRLLIATGQRREEVAGLRWAELDRDTATWTLPADRAKNDQAHVVPLNEFAMIELEAIAREATGKSEADFKWPRRGLVFSTTGKTSVSGFSRAKRRLDLAMAKIESDRAKAAKREAEVIAAWRFHDLRRTVATGLQRLGVRFEVTEAVLNHVSGAKSGVAGVYQRHDWKEEKRAALDAWNDHLSKIAFKNAAK